MKALAAALVAAFVAAPAFAATDRENLVVLVSASVVPRAIVFTTIEECTTRYPDIESMSLDAVMEWESRNLTYEQKAKLLAGKYALRMEKAEGKEVVDKLVVDTLNSRREQAVRETRAAFKRTFEKTPFGRHKESCLTFLMGMNGGKMDYRAIDKAAYELIQSDK
ncbi:hypothetical protein [Usitatibacter palustris]|uniref:Uncharacterized protein n=1 Tax=Usitatibacter palustris TaxID=2732487 RepID=A0A6M4HDH7_9PROT|nr:hypothetical protein [Usitatibacter palustris]QJR16047.1 hypothetical protein DSM104440_02875 [Usitatibacter palustris]